jgi:hypothetical protein
MADRCPLSHMAEWYKVTYHRLMCHETPINRSYNSLAGLAITIHASQYSSMEHNTYNLCATFFTQVFTFSFIVFDILWFADLYTNIVKSIVEHEVSDQSVHCLSTLQAACIQPYLPIQVIHSIQHNSPILQGN